MQGYFWKGGNMFKVGQKVRIRSNLRAGCEKYGWVILNDMLAMQIGIATISAMFKEEEHYVYHLKELPCYWVEEWLLPISGKKEEVE
jgi:hypothetical protein